MMWITILTRYSPAKGQHLEPGMLVEVQNEVALDLIRRGVATPVRTQAERAVVAPTQSAIGPGQV